MTLNGRLFFSGLCWGLVANLLNCFPIPCPAQEIQAVPADTREGRIERFDPRLDALIDSNQQMEVLLQGFRWSEGPVWIGAGQPFREGVADAGMGYLLFSDVPANMIYQWSAAKGGKVFMQPSQFDGGTQPANQGSNGMLLHPDGSLLVCDHGDRCIYRLDRNGRKTVLASHFEGKRFNSPNDLVLDSRGTLYFTDPPYGLRGSEEQELDFYGIFQWTPDGQISLISRELMRPNGIGLSPDEQTLYVAQSHAPAPIFQAYTREANGRFPAVGKLLFDASELAAEGGKGMPDGLAVDRLGNLWATGPGGVLILAPDGTLLGRITLPQATANCCFGGPAGSTLWITSHEKLGRIETKVEGWFPQPR
jgi:gluconolactonase